MQPWENRVVEEANLFNPAFCVALLARTTQEYGRKGGQPFPFALSFLVLPIVLHRQTRSSLPASTLTALLPWIQHNRDQLVDFPRRVSGLRGITREALAFGVQVSSLTKPVNAWIVRASWGGGSPPLERPPPSMRLGGLDRELADCEADPLQPRGCSP